MSDLEEHARQIRRAVAALREHADHGGIGPDDIAAGPETRRAARAAEALEDAIMRTLPLLGMDPPRDPRDSRDRYDPAHDPLRERFGAE